MNTTDPATFVLTARAYFSEPRNCMQHLVEDLIADGVDLREQGGSFVVALPHVRGRMWCESGFLAVETSADNAETAYFTREWLERAFCHLAAGVSVKVTWEENWGAHSLPPSFSILKVQAYEMISPYMKRITLSCPDVARFDRDDALHIQVLVNFDAVSVAADTAQSFLVWRRYTVRAINVSDGTIDVDIFLHGGSGPGASWAEAVRIGDLVGVAGPSGAGLRSAERYMIAGDETALPSIMRIIDQLPKEAKGDIIIEVEHLTGNSKIVAPEGMALSWVDRSAGQVSLEAAVIARIASHGEEQTFVWVGCEAQTARRLRNLIKHANVQGKLSHAIAGFWRKA